MNTSCIYVSDTSAGTITKLHSDGCRLTFATGLNQPAGLTFDRRNGLLVACVGDGTIQRLDLAGAALVFASGLDRPMGLAVDRSGHVYALCEGSQTIEKFEPSGARTTFASGLSSMNPYLAFDHHGINLYSANTHSIEKFAPDGTRTTKLTVLNFVYGIAFDNLGKLYVSLQNSGSIMGLPRGGNNRDHTQPGFAPYGLAYDLTEHHLYVAFGQKIVRYHLDECSSVFATGFQSAQYLALGVEA